MQIPASRSLLCIRIFFPKKRLWRRLCESLFGLAVIMGTMTIMLFMCHEVYQYFMVTSRICFTEYLHSLLTRPLSARPARPGLSPLDYIQRKALHHIDLNLVSHGYVSGVSLRFRLPLALSLLIDRGEDYFSHKTVNRPFQIILLTSCLIRNGF